VPKRGFTNARFRTEYTVINVGELGAFEDGSNVDLELVLKHGLTSKVTPLFKVLGNGDLQRKLTVRAQKFSKSAVQKINAAGGTAVEVDPGGHGHPRGSARGPRRGSGQEERQGPAGDRQGAQ
jgi:ribosomal protein L15